MPGVPLPDQATENFLNNAEEQARASLKGKVPDSMLTPITAAPPASSSAIPPPHTPFAPAGPATEDAQPLPPDENKPPAQNNIVRDNGSENTVGRAVWGSTKELGSEVGNALMRGATDIATTLGFAAVTLNHLRNNESDNDKGVSDSVQKVDDKIFGFLHDYVDSAHDYWTQDPKNSNAIASTVGGAVEGLYPMLFGPAGAGLFVGGSTVKGGKEAIDRGNSLTTAATLAVINGASATAYLLGPKDPNVVKRIAKWMGLGEGVDALTNVLTRYVLNQDAYKQAVDQYKQAGGTGQEIGQPSTFGTEYANSTRNTADATPDVVDPKQSAITALMQTVFALLHSPGAQAAVKKDPKAAAQAADLEAKAGKAGQEPPPPPPPGPSPDAVAPPMPPIPVDIKEKPEIQDARIAAAERNPPPPVVKPATPAAAPASVADNPTVEPLKDLAAQVKDAKDPNTPRQGVYLSKDTLITYGKNTIAALADGMVRIPNFDGKGGIALVPDKGTATAMRAFKATEPDTQKVLGRLTGAGDGKTADQTAVVQGQTPEGAVAKEQAVAPADVPAAVQATAAEGKTPVVTTPEAALAARAADVPPPPAPEPVKAAEPPPAPAVDKPVDKVAEPTGPKPLEKGDRRVVKVGGDDVPVVVDGPSKDGKVPVRMIDEDGRVSNEVRQVPEHMFGEEKAQEPKATQAPAEPKAGTTEPKAEPKAEPAPEPKAEPKAQGGDPELDEAVRQYKVANTPDPGRTKPNKDNLAGAVGSLARAVKAAAKRLAATLPDNVLDHALEATKPVEKIDMKTPESMAKSRGVNVDMLRLHAENLMRVVENLRDPSKAVITPKVAVKAEALKKRVKVSETKAAEDAVKIEAAKPEGEVETVRMNDEDEPTKPLDEVVKEGVAAYRRGALKLVAHNMGKVLDVDPKDWVKVLERIKEVVTPKGKSNAASTPKSEATSGADEAPGAARVKETAKAKRDAGTTETATDGEKVKSAIPDVADERKPKGQRLTAAETRDMNGAIKRYLGAHESEVSKQHDLLEQTLHKIFGADHANEVDEILHMVREQRDEEKMRAAAADDDPYTPKPSAGKLLSESVDDDEFRGKTATKDDFGSRESQAPESNVALADFLKRRSAADIEAALKRMQDEHDRKAAEDRWNSKKEDFSDFLKRRAKVEEDFREKTRPWREAMWDKQNGERMKANIGKLRDIWPGFKSLVSGTYVMATHGLKFSEPTRGKVVGMKVEQLNDGLYRLPVVDFGDGLPRTLQPGNIHEVLAPRSISREGPPTPRRKRWGGWFHRDTKMHQAWDKLHDDLVQNGSYDHLTEDMLEGRELSSKSLLAHIIKLADDGPIKDLMQHMLKFMPDVPVKFVHTAIDSSGEPRKTAVGLWSWDHFNDKESIQIALGRGVDVYTTQAIIHEMIHAATSKFMEAFPNHHLTKEMERLYEQAKAQIAGFHGQDVDPTYLDHFLKTGNLPEISKESPDYYGVTDIHEYAAEIGASPTFQMLTTRTHGYAASLFKPLREISLKMMDVIRDMFGVKGSRTLLLEHSLYTLREIMQEQYAVRTGNKKLLIGSPKDFERASEAPHGDELKDPLEPIERLSAAPPPLEHDEEFRSAIGERPAQIVRLFRNAVRSGSVEAVRQNVRGLTTFSQLIRVALRREHFGPNDSQNPLRQYHEAIIERDATINRLGHEVGNIVNDRAKLSYTDDNKLGEFQQWSTMYGINPEGDKAKLPAWVSQDPKFPQRWQEAQDRWKNFSNAQKDIYRRELATTERLFRAQRKTAIDVALNAYTDKDIPAAKRQLLYSVDTPGDIKKLVGKGKEIDVGERNDKLTASLTDLAGVSHMPTTYFHLGRHGDWVVHVKPEGTRTFADQNHANLFADRVRDLSPGSEAKVELVGGKWQVEYKAEYTSMHDSPAQAQNEIEALRAAGLEVGPTTAKLLSERNANLSGGVQNIIAETSRRIERRGGSDDSTKDLQDMLRQSFVQMMAARSSYAGSKLARKNVGGVKGSEMGRNFATHAQSMAWNTGHMAATIKIGEALGRMREAVKDPTVSQGAALARGRLYDELTRRLAQENNQYGQHTPFNSLVAKAGFLNYMTSLSHSLIYLTQNFSTAIPIAMARHGSWRAMDSFRASMALMISPGFREAFRGLGTLDNADDMLHAVYDHVAKDKRFGKWAQGPNSPLQQLIDSGAIHTSMSNQLSEAAKGGGKYVNRVFEYARILPSLADLVNRVSTGLAALELHKGDVYRAADFIRETHMDYSQGEKPRAFRAVSRLWGGNSVTMFRTYTQGMAHLLYSHVFDTVQHTEGGKAQAAMTVAGLMLGASLFAGVQRGVGLEPIRAAMWAYNKLVGDNDEYYNFDNMTRRFVAEVTGEASVAGTKVSDIINGGLPRAFGFDISSRMGLSDLFYHDPPDISSMDASAWGKIASGILGPGYQEIADQTHALSNAFATGKAADFGKAIPIKLLQNVLNAYTTADEGATNARGIHLTDPSLKGAAWNAIGVKSADQAKTQEKMNTDSDYKQWASTRENKLIERWLDADPADRQTIWSQIQNFSNTNPGNRITYETLRKAQVSRQKAQVTTTAIANDQPTRNPTLNKLNDY